MFGVLLLLVTPIPIERYSDLDLFDKCIYHVVVSLLLTGSLGERNPTPRSHTLYFLQ